MATAIECRVKGKEQGIPLSGNDLVFVTNGSCTEGTIYGDQDHAPSGMPKCAPAAAGTCGRTSPGQDPAFGRPEKFCTSIDKTPGSRPPSPPWTSGSCRISRHLPARPPQRAVVTGGIVSCQDSQWLLSWTINRQGTVQGAGARACLRLGVRPVTDVPGDYVKKPMRDCTGKEITEEWLYHIGVPVEQIPELAAHSAVCVPDADALHHRLLHAPRQGDRPDVIPDGCVNFAFLGQFADTPRDTVFTTEYSVRTAMEAVYGLLGVDRGVPEVWGSVYDIRTLLDSAVLPDGRPLASGHRPARASDAGQKASAGPGARHRPRAAPVGAQGAAGRDAVSGKGSPGGCAENKKHPAARDTLQGVFYGAAGGIRTLWPFGVGVQRSIQLSYDPHILPVLFHQQKRVYHTFAQIANGIFVGAALDKGEGNGYT